MNTSELITTQHLARQAVIYIRQSTQQQTLTNQESLNLQYALKQRAIDFGWGTNYIHIIDCDLGLTGSNSEKREGFKELVTKVTLGEVGIIFSYDVTRLSRNCSDWYPLLDVCGYKKCLIADRDSVYDPGSINGRLLLGLKGQIAEMELSTIKSRLNAGLLNKAQRGELALWLPTGLARNVLGQVCKDPNMEIQDRISLVFEMFLEKKTCAKVLRHFNENNITIPSYNKFKELRWKAPTISAITNILKNPAYAGAFTYGRSRTTMDKFSGGHKHCKKLPMKDWKIIVKDKYPKYIEWEIFEKIQFMLADNYAEYDRNKSRGVPRNGAALLQGITYCGECGHKMVVQYKGGNRYLCNYLRQQRLTPVCQYLPADIIDNYTVEQFFRALNPIELDAYTEAIKLQSESIDKTGKALAQQLERLKYQAKIAERQFNQVDPDNRLVAAELERRWEQSLQELKEAESELGHRKRSKVITEIPNELKMAFLDLGKKLPEVWQGSTLSRQQKKSFLRCLIDKVVVHKIKRDQLQIRIVWQGGETTTTKLPITVGSFNHLSFADEMKQIIINQSKAGNTDAEIANFLTKNGYRSPMKKYVLTSTVQIIRLKHHIMTKRSQSHPFRKDGYLTITQIAKIIDITPSQIYDRINNGSIKIKQINDSTKIKYLFKDVPETIDLFKNLFEGKLKIIDFSNKNSFEKNTSTKQVNRSIQT